MIDATPSVRSTLPSMDPTTGEHRGDVEVSTPDEVDAVIAAAAECARTVAAVSPRERSTWLEAIADALEGASATIVAVAAGETGLSTDRLAMELAGAVGQWRYYAQAAREGSWMRATIDHATDSAPDLRRVHAPVGPVVVFGASNFPLTFGMLGHDTASALAAGCPVVVKAHPAHPLLSVELDALARGALREAGAPAGALGTVTGFDAGRDAVLDPRVSAVAFTGSQAGGMALVALSGERDIPIPVYAEMGTVNPVIVTPAAVTGVARDLADGFVRSIRFGGGQVCTKPGLVFAPRGSGISEAVADALGDGPGGFALTSAIAEGYRAGVEKFTSAGARVLARSSAHERGWTFEATVLQADIELVAEDSPFIAECFGPVGIVVEYDDLDDVLAALGRMQGALTASVFAAPEDDDIGVLVDTLSSMVGRVVVGQWPSSVATTWSQHHGGPWPATSVPTATSVGADALSRFVRPIAFQNVPARALPPALRDDNPWRLPRREDGRLVQPTDS